MLLSAHKFNNGLNIPTARGLIFRCDIFRGFHPEPDFYESKPSINESKPSINELKAQYEQWTLFQRQFLVYVSFYPTEPQS